MRGPLASCLEDIAELAVALARPVEATRLLAAAEALRREHGMPMPPAERGQHQRRVAQPRTELAGEFTTARRAFHGGRDDHRDQVRLSHLLADHTACSVR
ncbi:MAG: hypothetical protein QOD04_2044 [Pseudonocardiales bacterium]|nr:hypothetical protein [Pseudonocardiales bacterium]